MYRPLALFGLEDKLLDVLTARYLRDSFDPWLEDSSLSFRAPGVAAKMLAAGRRSDLCAARLMPGQRKPLGNRVQYRRESNRNTDEPIDKVLVVTAIYQRALRCDPKPHPKPLSPNSSG